MARLLAAGPRWHCGRYDPRRSECRHGPSPGLDSRSRACPSRARRRRPCRRHGGSAAPRRARLPAPERAAIPVGVDPVHADRGDAGAWILASRTSTCGSSAMRSLAWRTAAGSLSTPITWPLRPTPSAKAGRSAPSPQPRSTTSPGRWPAQKWQGSYMTCTGQMLRAAVGNRWTAPLRTPLSA